MRTIQTLGIILVLAACGDSGPSIPLDTFATELQARRCELLVACNAAPDQATCLDANPVDSKTLTLVAAAKANALAYDGHQAYRCVEQLTAAGCLQSNAYEIFTVVANQDSTSRWYPCSAIFTSTAKSGTCFFDEQCSRDYGYRCQHAMDCTSDCCAGTCGVAGTDTCARDSDCVAGLLCSPSGTCVSGDEGASCANGSPCAPGLTCDINQTCSRWPAAQAACTTVTSGGPPGCDDLSDVCGPSLPGTCMTAPAAGTACVGFQCAFDASCDSNTNQCQPKPGLGQPCKVGSLSSPCLAPLYCAGGATGSTGMCMARPTMACN